MANDFGVVQTATLVSMDILSKLKFQLPMLFNFSHKFQREIKYGQTVTVHDVGEGAVTDVTPATAYTTGTEVRTDTDLSVTCDQWKMYNQKWAPADIQGSERNLVAEEGTRGAYVLANAVVDDILTTLLPTYANSTTTAAAAEDFDYDDARNINRILKKRQLMGPFTGVINSDAAYGLMGDSNLQRQDFNPGNDVIQSNSLTKVANINFSEYAGFPTIGATKIFGFVAQNDAMLLAAGAPMDVGDWFPGYPKNYLTGVETDSETGLSLRWLIFLNGQAQTAEIVYTLIYGRAIGKDNNMEVLISTT